MALVNAFGELSLEETQQQVADLASSINTLVQFMYANMPRVDAAKRMVTATEATQAISGSLTTVTTVSNVANQTLLGGFSPANERFMQAPPWIYNNIVIS